MLKKLCALIMAFAMAASLLAVGAGAAGNGLVRGDYKYYQMVENVKTECEKKGVTGDVITEVPVMNNTDAALDAALIVAVYNKADGKMVDVDYTAQALASKEVVTVAATVTVPNDENTYEIKEYLWNGLAKMVPGATVEAAPSAPTDLAVTGTTTTSTISLSWTAATGATVLGYNIYRDGVKVDSTVNTTYTDYALDDGTEYTYTVKAFSVNGEGAASNEVSGTTVNIATIKMSDLPATWKTSGIAAGTTKGNDGLDITGLAVTSTALPTFVTREEFNNVEALAANTYNIGEYFGKTAYASNEMSSGKYGMIFMIPSGSPLRTTDGDNTRTIIFTYYDNGTEPIWLSYRTADGATWKKTDSMTGISVVTRTGTDEWKTCAVTVTDAVFIANSMHLMFSSNTGNGDIYISEVGIAKNYVPKAEVLDADSLTAETGVLKYRYGTTNGTNAGITSGIDGDAANTTAFYLTRTGSASTDQPRLCVSVANSYLAASDRSKVKIRITYWDYVTEGKVNRIQLNYAGKVNNEGDVVSIEHSPVVLTGEKNWKTAEFILDDAWFNNGYSGYGSTADGACDFMLATGGGTVLQSDGETLYISKIEVIKIP